MAKGVALLVIFGFVTVLLDTAWCVECPPDSEYGEATYLPHESECGKFYECYNGKAKVFDCPWGTYFDTSLDVCNWTVNCGNLVTSTRGPTTTDETETPPAEQE